MNSSHKALGFPQFNVEEMVECTRSLLELDKDWIPHRPMHSMYIRPNSIAMDNKLGIQERVCTNTAAKAKHRLWAPFRHATRVDKTKKQ